MLDATFVGPLTRRFLIEYVVGERNFALNTQASYRDMLALFFPFTAEMTHQSVDRLTVEKISPDIVRSFLSHLEEARGCSVATRNQRLAAIHAWARFVGGECPEHVAWCTDICSIPFKRTSKPTMIYLDRSEMQTILATPDRSTQQGYRDYALLLFLYNSGARADEAARTTIADLNLSRSPAVKIVGKGSKVRICPLWASTVDILTKLVAGRESDERVFLNRYKRSMTRFGVHAVVKRYALRASQKAPSLRNKAIGPHTIRHTTAVHLLRAGVDINTIRAWLGHVSLVTTNIYAEVDLEMKAEALSHCEMSATKGGGKIWRNNRGLMEFLNSL